MKYKREIWRIFYIICATCTFLMLVDHYLLKFRMTNAAYNVCFTFYFIGVIVLFMDKITSK